jgi:hypothetical protein
MVLKDIHEPIANESRDILERRYLAERIYNRLLDESCPNVMGIYGGWGTGKTSLLNLVQERWQNSGNKNIQIEYMDAWNYEGNANLFVPVIVRMMSKRLALIPDWSSYFKRIATVALYMGTDLTLRAATGGNVKLNDIKSYEADMRESGMARASILDWEKLTDEVKDTQDVFSQLIEKANEAEHTTHIVFLIDNLDRCSPENVVSLLESIKNFLTIQGCTWIFAMDSEVVASYISRKYQGTKMDGTSYLDKIVPEQYHLSFYSEENDPRVFNLIYEVTGSTLTLNNEKRLPQIPRAMVPRRLKKSAAKFAEYFDGTNPDADRHTIFLLSLLYHTWPEFYERLSSPSLKHVGGILANFFRDSKNQEAGWGEYMPLPLDPDYKNNPDLNYFLQIAFPTYATDTEVAKEIHRAVNGLRRIGLP